jgi:hypothetical protein
MQAPSGDLEREAPWHSFLVERTPLPEAQGTNIASTMFPFGAPVENSVTYLGGSCRCADAGS